MIGVGALIFGGDQVLLVRRGSEPALGKWSLPGGLVELGETLESAVCREVLEETGLEVRIADVVAVLDRIIYDDERNVQYHYVLLDFLCHPVRGMVTAGSDVTACSYVSLEDLPLYPLTDGTEAVIRRAFSKRSLPLPPIYDPVL
jgi:ADP-ribose pyrophosphatase YjhB (NUDIX family)